MRASSSWRGVHALPDRGSVGDYAAEVRRALRPIAARGPVLCADHRPVVVYGPEVADAMTNLFVDMNGVRTRIAVVVAPTNATLIT